MSGLFSYLLIVVVGVSFIWMIGFCAGFEFLSILLSGTGKVR